MEAAAHVLRLYRFLVGFEEDLDELLVMLRARLGWRFRQLLSLRSEEAAAEKRRVFAPGLKGWPLGYVLQLNKTRALQDDWRFLGLMKGLRDEQRAAFGVRRAEGEAAQLRAVAGALEAVCDPRQRGGAGQHPSSSSSSTVVPRGVIEATIKQVQAGVGSAPCGQATPSTSASALAAAIRGQLNGERHESDGGKDGDDDGADYTETAAATPKRAAKAKVAAAAAEDRRCSSESGAVFKCMLNRYDNCKAGIGPRSLCDFFDEE